MVADGILVALISGVAFVAGSLAAFLVNKRKEREAAWRDKRLSYYEEFFAATSGIVGATSPPDTKIRFARAVNNLHLVGPAQVIPNLPTFTDDIAVSNANRHDILWPSLVWEIRRDLGTEPTNKPDGFRARLWASGVAQAPEVPLSLGVFTEWASEKDRVFDNL